MRALLFILLITTSATSSAPTTAADMQERTNSYGLAETQRSVTRHHMSQRAVLLMLRAKFGVIARDEIPALLQAELRALGVAGPTQEQQGQLEQEVLSEVSYFLVALRYLVESGGAVWPRGKPETTYAENARIQIAQLLDDLFATVTSGGDALRVVKAADLLYALTEGSTEPTGDFASPSDRDALVDRTLASLGQRSAT